MISDAEHLFVCLLAICALALESAPYKRSSGQARGLGSLNTDVGFTGGSVVKNLPALQETWLDPWAGRIP